MPESALMDPDTETLKLSEGDSSTLTLVLFATEVPLQRKLEMLESTQPPAQRIGRHLLGQTVPDLTPVEKSTADVIRGWVPHQKAS